MNCDHGIVRDRHFNAGNGSPACFNCWQAERNEARQTRRNYLAQILERGQSVRQDDRIWQFSALEGRVDVYNEHTCRSHEAFVRFAYNADTLAEHLENREHGFGWTITVLCFACGDVELTVGSAVVIPECATCQAKIDGMEHRFSADDQEPMYCWLCGASETDHRL